MALEKVLISLCRILSLQADLARVSRVLMTGEPDM